MKGPAAQFAAIGTELADRILAKGGRALLDAVYCE